MPPAFPLDHAFEGGILVTVKCLLGYQEVWIFGNGSLCSRSHTSGFPCNFDTLTYTALWDQRTIILCSLYTFLSPLIGTHGRALGLSRGPRCSYHICSSIKLSPSAAKILFIFGLNPRILSSLLELRLRITSQLRSSLHLFFD